MRMFARLAFVVLVGLPFFPLVAFAQAVVLPPTCRLTVSPNIIPPSQGVRVTVAWTSQNATGAAITNLAGPGVSSPVTPSGSVSVAPTQSTTYTGTFSGYGGLAHCSASVTVSAANTGGGGVGTGGTGGGGTIDTGGTGGGGMIGGGTVSGGAGVTQTPKNGGLVTCGTGSGALAATECQFCNFAQLIQGIINFIIGLAIPLAAALFAWAGILYFTSATNPKNITRAKSIFFSVLVGFLIALAGWLIIQTLLKTILAPSYYSGWNTISCVDQKERPRSGTIDQLLAPLTGNSGGVTTSGGGISVSTSPAVDPDTGAYLSDPTAGPGGKCPSGYFYAQDGNDSSSASCENPDGKFADIIPAQTSGGGDISSGVKITQAEAFDKLNPNITLKSGASLEGVQITSIEQLNNLQEACGCKIVITEGTGGTHAIGEYSHGNGYKIDARATQDLGDYIRDNLTYAGERSNDGAPLYKDAVGNTYAFEYDPKTNTYHWDIQFKKVGPIK